jgi:hypothetical protein
METEKVLRTVAVTSEVMTGERMETEKVDELLSKGLGRVSIRDVDEVSPQMCETLIAKELNRLSLHEREEVLSDLHGVSCIVDEKPQCVEESLCCMEAEISQIPNRSKSAYLQALSLSPDHVKDRSLRLMFLRASQFDASAAAKQMVEFFEQKLKIFGPDKLVCQICYKDLDGDTIACLNSGYIQLLSGRDRVGRSILMVMGKLRSYRSEQCLKRCFWYVAMAALEDEETQKRGIVCLSYAVGAPLLQKSTVFQLSSILRVIPFRVVGIHSCVDDPKMQVVARLATLMMDPRHRVRFRCHCGK